MRLEAALRLRSVRIVKEGYSDSMGRSVLGDMTDVFAEKPDAFKTLGQRNGIHFRVYDFKTGIHKGINLICFRDSTAVGSLHITPKRIWLDDKTLQVGTASSYLIPDMRGRGVMLGMYEWAITVFNLISDSRQSRMSHNLWKRLGTQYNVKTIRQVKGGAYETSPGAKWTDPEVLLLIENR